MSERWARMLLSTYRWAGAASYPFIGPVVAWRIGRRGQDKSRRRERYGRAGCARPPGPLIWMHAARQGETAAVIGLVEAILDRGIKVVLTTGTATSARIAAERLGDRIIHQYVPLDLKPAVSRFLDHWQPDLAIIAESEIWPMTILELGARRVPQVLVNGRMSDRAFASWKKRAYLAEALFENLSLVVAQSELDGERFRALGARPVKVSGNLKIDITAPRCDPGKLDDFLERIGGRPHWSALWTRAGEEAAAGEVHRLLKTRHPHLLSVVVPADPARADAVEGVLKADGLNVARRARGDEVTPGTDILLGDTVGETGFYTRLSQITFLGGSLSQNGGHNPLETVLSGAAVLTGEDVSYHRDIYQPLIACGGIKLVRDQKMLAGAVNFLLNNGKACAEMAAAAQRAAQRMRGPLASSLRELEPFIHPLVVKARLEDTVSARR